MTVAVYLQQLKQRLRGSHTQRGIFGSIALYSVLIFVGFVFLYPILMMISSSAKGVLDLANPLVRWIPSRINTDNYVRAYAALGGIGTLFDSMWIMLSFALAQTVSSAAVGYGLAKYRFGGHGLVMVLLLATFILPPQTTFLARYVWFSQMKMLQTIYPILLPSLLGQGINSAIFVLIFYQFFRIMPKSLDDAAFIDGAGHITTFLRINLPMAIPAIVVVFIFSFVWNWNETTLSGSYFGTGISTLPLALDRFVKSFTLMFPEAANNPMLRINEGIQMAGTLLTIIPLVVLYIIIERQLIESLDRTGITGE